MLTNKYNLPSGIVQAVENDPYTRGNSDISVTGLIAPPYLRKLREEVEVVEDVADRIWSLLGQSVHTILERAYQGSGIAEQRLFMPVNGWTVSGQMDVLEDGVLSDFKVTSVWSRDGKLEWEQQLNLLRLLCEENGHPVERLQIIAIYRDWQMSKTIDKEYPETQVGVIPVSMWSLDKAKAFMLERVKAHQHEEPPSCTDDERWLSPAVWAVKKDGRKSAIRLLDDQEKADLMADELGKGHFVEFRPGEYRRCTNYCNVSHACPVWQGDQNPAPF
jgi:hypothetical protein